MKIQSLAIIFIILILPISILLSSYTQNRVQTINLQSTYDSKLNDATYDALKAYQLNSYTSGTGDYTNSKIRDIKASVNTFFNSMSNSFSSLGYTKETLQNYTPAIVYTMYDGYYIYSPYKNTWSVDSNNPNISEEMSEQITTQNTYSNGELLFGLKPYVYYSCRYKGSPNQPTQEDSQFDIVITYSLDSYIQIQGYIKENGQKKTISKYGYLLSNTITPNVENNLRETISYIDYNGNAQTKELPCIKINGTKYYNEGNLVFSVLNGKAIDQSTAISAENISKNDNALKYYDEAKNLKDFIESSPLKELTTDNIVKEGNNDLEYFEINGSQKIFDFDYAEGIEAEDSNFNTHRINIIKNSIIKNLSVAMANFNKYSAISTDFQMPKLKDTDWDKIMNNISIITFMQGANIGGKIYNGYSIITNTKNEDVVSPDSIYIKTTSDNVIHRITENGLDISGGAVGVFNVNLEKRTGQSNGSSTNYYFPIYGTLSYDSIVTQNKVSPNFNGNTLQYVKSLPENLKTIYYTALARERYGIYRQKLEI